MSPMFRNLLLSNVSGVGGSLMRARSSAVDTYPIFIPPYREQQRIVSTVERIFRSLEEIQESIDS